MRHGGVVPLLLLLTACSTPSVLLLPGEGDNPTGALAVIDENGNDQQVLDKPLSSASLGRGRSSVRTVSSVKPRYGQIINTLPPPEVHVTLYFFQNTTTMTPESRPNFDYIREISKRPGVEVQVTGHTDTLGSEEDNDRLSEARAREIMGALIKEGIPAELLSAVGRGEREPAEQTGDGVASAANRRVEVIVR